MSWICGLGFFFQKICFLFCFFSYNVCLLLCPCYYFQNPLMDFHSSQIYGILLAFLNGALLQISGSWPGVVVHGVTTQVHLYRSMHPLFFSLLRPLFLRSMDISFSTLPRFLLFNVSTQSNGSHYVVVTHMWHCALFLFIHPGLILASLPPSRRSPLLLSSHRLSVASSFYPSPSLLPFMGAFSIFTSYTNTHSRTHARFTFKYLQYLSL